ncbi:hypothetical protein C7W93_21720 [Glaciimonas sp. PCH181]|nr:hypothetical protein C7W93_21720 [Glaciimonas sp. PCH181]
MYLLIISQNAGFELREAAILASANNHQNTYWKLNIRNQKTICQRRIHADGEAIKLLFYALF